MKKLIIIIAALAFIACNRKQTGQIRSHNTYKKSVSTYNLTKAIKIQKQSPARAIIVNQFGTAFVLEKLDAYRIVLSPAFQENGCILID